MEIYDTSLGNIYVILKNFCRFSCLAFGGTTLFPFGLLSLNALKKQTSVATCRVGGGDKYVENDTLWYRLGDDLILGDRLK